MMITYKKDTESIKYRFIRNENMSHINPLQNFKHYSTSAVRADRSVLYTTKELEVAKTIHLFAGKSNKEFEELEKESRKRYLRASRHVIQLITGEVHRHG